MPSPIKGCWSLEKLLQITYQAMRNRFEYSERDVIKSGIQIRKVSVYDGKDPGKARTRYDIISQSYPQYYPYFTRHDSRGRLRSYQRTYRHQYLVTIQMDKLCSTSPVKIRTGSNKRWVKVSPSLIKSKSNPYGQYLSEGDYNIQVNGINPDFYFRQMWTRSAECCLFGPNLADKAPEDQRYLVPFLNKHEIMVVTTLLEKGVFKE